MTTGSREGTPLPCGLRHLDGTAYLRRVSRDAEASEAVLYGRWREAARILDELIAEADAGAAPYYGEPAWRGLRASIELARGDLEGASAESGKALDRARTTKDPQLLAPALTIRGLVVLAQGRRDEASALASEVLALGSTLVAAFLGWLLTSTPLEFAWLLRDLEREAELLSALESAPSTPWVESARAIARGESEAAIDLIAGIGAPSVEAYTRLRVAEELARAGRHEQARDCLSTALSFFTDVGATRYLAQAEQLLAASP